MKSILINICKAILLSSIFLNSAQASEAPSQAFGELTPSWLQGMNNEQDWKTWIVLPVITRHFDRQAVIDDNLSEQNPGIGIERSNGTWRYLLGAYRNSLRDPSIYAQVAWTPLQFPLGSSARFAAGGSIGLVSGYQDTDKGYPIVPAGGFLLAFETDYHLGLNLFIVPTVQAVDVEGFVAAQLKFHF